MSTSNLPSWLGDFIGIPYVVGGRSMDAADCWGLFSLVHKKMGTNLPDYNGPEWSTLRSEQKALGIAALNYAHIFTEINAGEEQFLDGILFRMAGIPIHLGLVVEPGIMLHTEMGTDSCLVSYKNDILWTNRIIGYYRHKIGENDG